MCRDFCTEEMSHIIIQLHVLMGCDSNSGFFGHGKRKLFEICSKSLEAGDFLQNCGNALPITEDIMADLKAFIVKYVYGDKKSKTISESQALKWKLQKNRSILRLPPEDDSLELHLVRANCLTYIQKNYWLTVHPSPIGNGWKSVNRKCRAHRYRNPELPVTSQLNPQLDDSLYGKKFENNQNSDADSNIDSDSDGELSDYE